MLPVTRKKKAPFGESPVFLAFSQTLGLAVLVALITLFLTLAVELYVLAKGMIPCSSSWSVPEAVWSSSGKLCCWLFSRP